MVADGHRQVLHISNYDESLSLFKLQKRDTSASMGRTSSQSSRDGEFEAKEVTSPTTLTVNLSLEGIGISLINRAMSELLYASFRGIRLTYGDSAISRSFRTSIKWIQIDNQLFGGIFPLLVYPSVIPRDGKDLEVPPNLQIAVTLLKDQGQRSLLISRVTEMTDSCSSARCTLLQVCQRAAPGNDSRSGRRFPICIA